MPDVYVTHNQLCGEHHKSGAKYAESRTVALSAFEDLLSVDDRVRRVLEDSGLDAGEPRESLSVDWYSSDQAYREHRVSYRGISWVWLCGGVAALVGAIGIQLGSWTGAGAEHAGAARWFGVAHVSVNGPVGEIELALTPLVLSLICLAVGVGLLAVVSLMARIGKRRAERDVCDANGAMEEAIARMEANGARLGELGNNAGDVSKRLSRAIGALQANRNQVTVDGIYKVMGEAGHLYSKVQEPLPHARLYIGRPGPVDSVTSVEATTDSVTIKWEDPDQGVSSIEGYLIRHGGGFLRGEKYLATVEGTEFTHTGLKPGKSHTYKIVPFNKIGEAAADRSVDARTQEG